MTWKTEWWELQPQNRIQRKEWKKNEDSLRDLWDNIEHTNIHIREVQEAEEEQRGP